MKESVSGFGFRVKTKPTRDTRHPMLRFHHTTTGSTNDAAQRMAVLNPGAPLLVSARTQTRGRGRHGRVWRSPPGGAWFSVAWPAVLPLDHYAAAPLVVGLAVANAIEGVWGEGNDPLFLSDTRHPTPDTLLQIKWPNDILLRGRKLAGILCETCVLPDAPRTLVLGVGINVNVETAALGDGLRHPAISLCEATGRQMPLQPIIDACGRTMAKAMRRLEGHGLTEGDVTAIESRLAWRGEPVTMHAGKTVIHGVLDGVEPDGRLRLLTPRGVLCFHSGEVHGLRAVDSVEPVSCLTSEVLA